MDVHLTAEQILLRDSAAKFITAAGPKVAMRAFARAPAKILCPGDCAKIG